MFPFNLHTLSTMYNVHRPSSVDCLVYSSDILAYLFELLNPFDKDKKENRTFIWKFSYIILQVKWHVNDFKCDKFKRQNYSPDEPDAELPVLNSTSGVENPTSGAENFNDIRFRGSSTTVESTAET